MFNFIDIYRYIPMSNCVGMGPMHCFVPGVMMLRRSFQIGIAHAGKDNHILWYRIRIPSGNRYGRQR